MTTQIGDVLRITAGMTYGTGGGDLQNTMHWQHNGTASLSDSNTVVQVGQILEQLYGTVLAQLPDHIKFVRYDVFNVTQSIITGFGLWPSFVAGTNPGPPTSPQVCPLIHSPTNKSRVMGRVSLPPFTEAAVTDGIWDAPTVTALINFAALLLTQLISSALRLDYVVLNRVLGTFQIPVGAVVGAASRTQRRRSIGFGS